MQNLQTIRQEFPTLAKNSAAYLDNAATTQVASSALQAMHTLDSTMRGTVHRGLHSAVYASTQLYEQARNTVQNFVHARSSAEIIFTKNCTESLNIAIKSWGTQNLTAQSTVYISYSEHHSMVVPWLQLQAQISFTLMWIPLTVAGAIDIDALEQMCTKNTPACIAVTGLSNVLGIKTDLLTISAIATNYKAMFLVDAAQLVAHERIDVQVIDCDFLAFSGHKLYGPTGIGVLYGKKNVLTTLPPFLGGGMMVEQVTTTSFTPVAIPQKFEAGTPPFVQAIGLAASIDWLQTLDWNVLQQQERMLLQTVRNTLASLPNIVILPTHEPTGCISFYHTKIHAHDIADILSEQRIFVRAGHHCAQPLHTYLQLPATVRISIGLYTTLAEVETCLQAITNICTHIV